MSPKRKETILTSLRAGNKIHRMWRGGSSGYLSHWIEGVDRLRESEVEELLKEGLIELFLRPGPHKPYVLKKTNQESEGEA